MSNVHGCDISSRAEVVRDWEDFLCKHKTICAGDEYDETTNPEGIVNLGTALNNICKDIILPRLTSVWTLDPDVLQYKEGYGILRLRKALAAVMTEFFETHEPVDPENLFCVSGVTGCIDILAHCLADPGDVILAPTPIYGRINTDLMQRSRVKLLHIQVVTENNGASSEFLTIEKVKKAYNDAISKKHVVKAVILINPNNPVGDIYSPELLLEIFSFCDEHNLHVIVDEVYALSVFGGNHFHSTLKFASLPNKKAVHVLYGMSKDSPEKKECIICKDFGLAGLRIGVIHTQCEALQKCLKQLCFFQSISVPMMDIAARFLEDLEWCKMYITKYQERLTEKFKHCVERVKEMGLNVRESSGGFFLWLDLRPICGSDSFEKETDLFDYLLEEYRVYIVPGKELFCAQPGWFRVTFTSYPEDVDEGLKRLEEGIKNYKSAKV